MGTYGAFGLVEGLGEANGVLAADCMLKAAEVEYITHDTQCGGHALIFIGGSVSAVKAALDNVKENMPCNILQSAVISNPSGEMVKIVEHMKIE